MDEMMDHVPCNCLKCDYHTTETTDNHKICISCICNNWINHCIRHPKIAKRECQIIIGVLSIEILMYLILRWYWSIMDSLNN